MSEQQMLPPPKPLVARKWKNRSRVPLLALLALLAIAVAGAYWTLMRRSTLTAVPETAAKAPAPAASGPKHPATPAPAKVAPEKKPVAIPHAEEEARLAAVARSARRPDEAPSHPAPTITTQLAPGITATTTARQVAGAASPAFRAWVGAASINGVFQGTPARALINGHIVQAGQMVEAALGISFDHIDADAKTIVFRDRSGATVSRPY
jgi:hypothetical protein